LAGNQNSRFRVLLIDGEWKASAYGSLLEDARFEFISTRSSEFAGMTPQNDIDVILLDDDFGSLANAVLPAWREAGIPSVQIADGILDWRNSFDHPARSGMIEIHRFAPTVADVVVCLGPWQAYWLSAWGSACPISAGLPRLDKIGNAVPAKRPAANRTRVLVCSANTPGFTPEHLSMAETMFRDVLEWANAAPTDRFEFDWRISESTRKSLNLDFPNGDTRDPHEQLRNADLVISQPSTIALESMALGKPTAILDYSRFPKLLVSAFEISHAGAIGPILDAMHSASDRLLRHQDELLRLQWTADGMAANRVSNMIARLAQLRRGGLSPSPDLVLELGFASVPNIQQGERTDGAAERATREIAHLRNALVESRAEIERIRSSNTWRFLQWIRRISQWPTERK